MTEIGSKLEQLKKNNIVSNNSIDFIRINSPSEPCIINLFCSKLEGPFLGIFHEKGDVILKKTPLIKGLKVDSIKENKKVGTRLKPANKSGEDVFIKLCDHIARKLKDVAEPVKASTLLSRELKLWKLFFSNSKAPLNKEGILGLVGEIITLSKIVDTGARSENHLIEGWSGPKRELHDFNYDKILFEVKTSALSENMRFKISSPAQLLETDEKPLYLVHQIFSWNSSGISLNEFIENFKQRLNSSKTSIVLFEELIHEAGYHSMHYDFYDSDELRLSLKNLTYTK